MYYLCDKYYKHITVQYYIANFVSWASRVTLLDLGTCSEREQNLLVCRLTSEERIFPSQGHPLRPPHVQSRQCFPSNVHFPRYHLAYMFRSVYREC